MCRSCKDDLCTFDSACICAHHDRQPCRLKGRSGNSETSGSRPTGHRVIASTWPKVSGTESTAMSQISPLNKNSCPKKNDLNTPGRTKSVIPKKRVPKNNTSTNFDEGVPAKAGVRMKAEKFKIVERMSGITPTRTA